MNMAKRRIITYPDPVLKEVAEPVSDITSEIRELAHDMAETMYAAPGVGLAANQIGILKRIIVFDLARQEEDSALHVLVNPEIVAAEGESAMEEGCLSVIDFSSTVRRSANVTVRALDLDGRTLELEGEGLMAIVLQHEIDHLNGTLFIDRISSLKRMLYKRHLKKLLEEK